MEKSIQLQLENTRKAKRAISVLTIEQKMKILNAIADELLLNTDQIILENQKDLDRMDPQDSKYDRLKLTKARIEDLADSVRAVAKLDDPTGKLLSSKTLDNGLLVEKRSVALGVVGVIYESRPNVTIDVAVLCIQSGNVCLLRGGSDAWFSNTFLVNLIQDVLLKFNTDPCIVQLLPTDRELVTELLTAVKYVDILIPRGSQGLIDFVRENAKVPVIETGAGVCHTYIDKTADLSQAAKIVANAKISRPSVCNALDCILVDSQVTEAFLNKLAPLLAAAKVKILADEKSYSDLKNLEYPNLEPAKAEDFGREFLDLICSMKVVNNLDDALDHIANYSSKHSECIISSDPKNILTFMNAVDAAAVYSNASTRFTDGAEFGLGAEIGISTQKLHARGPFALEKLVTEKWFVTGEGQIR
ncbi:MULTISPECIES: glutamate-5-semialdehyde dehydrogenase [Sphingobacterium]|uniref:Gamma-glutamyl phosphate reductase n=1 Tax=Sphingobacterium cellulitidis TaxID=1768011 RepID=A0A8H9FX23_9SPHI|nr:MULTISPECIES: glutamate-5-semialdehyde dehydrogenase [Sphingobacterium]MBA8985468.1 glutamate-5-semialdehyde dehydrogenase [Sphingobacterium soli]WFB63889.1 glutamate-5-semialdehyde dehydrogenase [Sphingobacterium sp. WM]GGE09433.1 gamma-glutamyl phosphate reductase [Sphingobacterium soli]